MAEWGKYLKNAVANVEQQLDRVLLENQDGKSVSLPSKPHTRPDLSERLKLAATGKVDATTTSKTETTVEDDGQVRNAEKEECENRLQPTDDAAAECHSASCATDAVPSEVNLIDLLTLKSFADAPRLEPVLSQARKIALIVKRDDTLALVDDLERTDRDLEAYTKYTTEKLQSLHSKLAIMCNERAKVTQGPEQQVALLMEEGQRLSQQELKLGMLVKKLRSDFRESQSKLNKHSDQSAQIEKLNLETTQLRTQNRELEALVANYRAQLNEAPISENDGNSKSKPPSSDDDLQKYVTDRENWHRLETQLLKRISELERDSSSRHASTSQLQQNLVDAQRQSRKAQDQIVELQDELDATKLSSKQEVDALRQELVSLKNKTCATVPDDASLLSTKDQTVHEDAPKTNHIVDSAKESITSVTNSSVLQGVRQLHPTSPVAVEMLSEIKLPNQIRSLAEQPTFYTDAGVSPGIVEHDPFTLISDEQTVGPSGPFGSLGDRDSIHALDADDGLYGIENEESSLVSRRSVDSLNLWGNRSRQDSAVNSLNEGANSHLIKKLTLSVRRLQNDLSAAKQDAQLARQQRQEVQTEIVKYFHLQEKLSNLESSYSRLTDSQKAASDEIERLTSQLNNKSEIVEELEADIRDLKDMYRDQVETLVSEIEKLKR